MRTCGLSDKTIVLQIFWCILEGEIMNRKMIVKLAVGWIAFIILCVCIVFYVESGQEEKKALAKSNTSTSTEEQNEEEQDNPLLKDQYPEINALITDVLKAWVNCDMEKLKFLDMYPSIYNDSSEFQKAAQIVKGYENLQCYTKKGMKKDSYIVFAVVDTKIAKVDTLAPGLFQFYVVKDMDDLYKIDSTPDSERDAATVNYIQKVAQEEDALNLVANVTMEYQNALKKDKKLKKYISSGTTADDESTEATDQTTAAQLEDE